VLIPEEPPFTAYVGNLPYQCVQGDVEQIFAELKVRYINMNLDRDTGNFRGFAFVEFDDKESLIKALEFDGQAQFGDRNLKVDIPESHYNRRGGGRGGRGGGDDRGGRGGRGRGSGGGFGGGDRYDNFTE